MESQQVNDQEPVTNQEQPTNNQHEKIKRVTKDPKKIEAGRKGAAARKAKHDEVLEKLRKAKEPDQPPKPLDHVYINPVYVGIAVATAGAIYYFVYSPKPTIKPVTEPTIKPTTKRNPFEME